MYSDLIRDFESKQIQRKRCFHVGDTIEVKTWMIIEGDKKRFQIFEGIVISFKNRGLNSTFIVRKISSGEGVERVFFINSPTIDNIKVKKFGIVRKSKLFFLRKLSGKSARIKTRLN